MWKSLEPLWVSVQESGDTHHLLQADPFCLQAAVSPRVVLLARSLLPSESSRVTGVVKEAQSGGVWAVCNQGIDEVRWWLPSEPLKPGHDAVVCDGPSFPVTEEDSLVFCSGSSLPD